MQTSRSIAPSGNRRGVALVIILAFVVLLTGLVIAFFSRSMLDRQISNSSVSRAKVNAFADGAVNAIIGQLRQEIVLSSSASPVTSGTIYIPITPAAMLPQLTGTIGITGTAAPNVLKISNPGQPFYTGSGGAIPSTAVAISSTTPSLNGRYVSLARWNEHYLLPLANSTDSTPDPTSFIPPAWVLVARDSSNPTAWSSNLTASTSSTSSVVGRYAFAVYHEGGLLDVNAAGYPSTTSTNLSAYKPALVYADLTQLPGGLTGAMVDKLVAWRNFASIPVTGSSFLVPGFTAGSGSNYFNLIVSNTTGFLAVSSTAQTNSQTDRMFTSRQELIKFLQSGLGLSGTSLSVLNYLATFTRDINQPSYVRLQSTNAGKTLDYNPNVPKVLPATAGGNNYGGANVDDQVNPSFLGVRVQPNKTFQRNDGTMATAGEPLVKKRFALNRLAWLTYKGPSGGGNGSAPRNLNDPDMQALINNGIPPSYLQQGTAIAIQNYFGLTWNGSNAWTYNVHNGSSGSGPSGAIMKLPDIVNLGTPREPDFFELLKATINVGSLGKALLPSNTSMPADPGVAQNEHPCNYNYYAESSVDFQIIQIGANIISQFQTSNYPPRIVFDDGSGSAYVPHTFAGVSNLPYLSSVVTGVVQVQAPAGTVNKTSTNPLYPRSGKPAYNGGTGSGTSQNSGYQAQDVLTSPGIGAVIQFPVVWNPHDPASSVGAAGAGPTQFRVVADSATPDQAEKGTGQYSLFAYAAAVGGSAPSSLAYSYLASSSSPNSSWYRDPAGTGYGIAQPLTADNSAVEFSLQSGTAPIFSEPAMLVTPGTITDSGSNAINVACGASSAMQTRAPVSTLFSGGGLPSFNNDSQGLGKYGSPYVGIYLGAFPLAWYYTAGTSTPPLSAAQTGAYVARYTGVAGPPAGSYQGCYFTYRMQYKDPAGNWVTYDTKYGKTFNDFTQLQVNLETGICGAGSVNSAFTSQAGSGGFWAFAVDPRTSRFGLLWEGTYPNDGPGLNSPFTGYAGYRSFKPLPCYTDTGGTFLNQPGGWVDQSNWISLTVRPDRVGGWYAMAGWPFSGGGGAAGPGSTSGKMTTGDGTGSGWMAFIASNVHNEPGGTGGSYPGLQPGVLAQNNADVQSFYQRYTADGGGGSGQLNTPQYFADPDGIVRRGMAAFVPPDGTWPAITSVGLPMAQTFRWSAGSTPNVTGTDSSITPYNTNATPPQQTSEAQSRPYMLHRPFRSVGELGYVFFDTPWRNLDFSTAESGASALLDVFCINETNYPNGLIAGKVNLNTRQAPVLQAILAQAYLDPVLISGTSATARIDSASTAGLVAQALVARTSGTSSGLGPLENLSELVGTFVSETPIHNLGAMLNGGNQGTLDSGLGFYDGKLSYSGFSDGGWDITARTPKLTGNPATDVYSAYQNSSAFSSSGNKNGTRETISYIQRFREAPIRALAAAGQTRIWNLLIDVVAQTGRYPQSAADLSKFMVEGEQHYWVHVAIDRYTGQVIDKQIEIVKE